jgi:hypothetical protein
MDYVVQWWLPKTGIQVHREIVTKDELVPLINEIINAGGIIYRVNAKLKKRTIDQS